MIDWSHLDYKKHKSKKELISKDKKGNAKQIGYDLQTTLAISHKTGEPIAPYALKILPSSIILKKR